MLAHFSDDYTAARDPSTPYAAPEPNVMATEDLYMKNSGGLGAMNNLALTAQFPTRKLIFSGLATPDHFY